MATPKKRVSVYHEVVAEHLARLERLAERRGVARLKKVYDEAQAEVVAKIARLTRTRKGGSFDAHQKRLILAQLGHGQKFVAKKVGGELNAAAKDTQHDVLRALPRAIARLENEYRGTAPVVPIEDVARFQGVIDGRRDSLLRRHETSLDKYGQRNVTKVEDALSKSLLEGESHTEAIDRVSTVLDLQWWEGERIVRCLPGETCVTGAVVRAAHRRWHEGTMVEIITARGGQLTATPNHPMLTRRGWVLQGEIVPGDYLVRHHWEQDSRATSNEHIARGPSTIAQIFDAISAVGICEGRRGAKPDFHGEWSKGQVDIARVDRELMYGIFAALTKPATEQLFSPSDGSGARFCPLCAGLLPYERACLCEASDMNTHLPKPSRYDAMVNAIRCSDLWAAFAGLIAPPKFFAWEFESLCAFAASASQELRIESGANNSRSAKMTIDTMPRDSVLNSDLVRAHAGEIELDRVLDIRHRQFSGHVYNLSTANGYYAINGYYTGNTELAWAASATQMDGIAVAREVIPDLMSQWRELVSDDGQPLDDRVGVDSLAMHGQVVIPGSLFTCPPRTTEGEEVPEGLVLHQVAFPPLRPNGRETIIPWRAGWEIPAWRWAGRRVPML